MPSREEHVMPHIEWDETLETGDPDVDEQHRGLVSLFNELVDAEVVAEDPKHVNHALERLTEYVIVHFTAEEALMHRIGYPADVVGAHVGEHRALTARTREMVIAFRSGAESSVVPLVDFLCEWLVEHVEESDRRFVEFMQGAA
jgi:hemerythrin